MSGYSGNMASYESDDKTQQAYKEDDDRTYITKFFQHVNDCHPFVRLFILMMCTFMTVLVSFLILIIMIELALFIMSFFFIEETLDTVRACFYGALMVLVYLLFYVFLQDDQENRIFLE